MKLLVRVRVFGLFWTRHMQNRPSLLDVQTDSTLTTAGCYCSEWYSQSFQRCHINTGYKQQHNSHRTLPACLLSWLPADHAEAAVSQRRSRRWCDLHALESRLRHTARRLWPP